MTKFVNVLIQTYDVRHVQAVIDEAERLGYKPSELAILPDGHVDRVQCVHLKRTGEFYLYRSFSAYDLLYRDGNKLHGAVELKKLIKLRGMMEALNNPVLTESQDNMAVLSVIERPKYDIVTTQPIEERNLLGKGMILAPYGASEFPDCVCLGVDVNARKTCRMGKAYGGGCQLERATKADYDNMLPDAPVKFVRPNAENPVVTRVVRFLAVTGTKVLGLIKRVYNHLRGGL